MKVVIAFYGGVVVEKSPLSFDPTPVFLDFQIPCKLILYHTMYVFLKVV